MRSLSKVIEEVIYSKISTKFEVKVPNSYLHYVNGWDGLSIRRFTSTDIYCRRLYERIIRYANS